MILKQRKVLFDEEPEERKKNKILVSGDFEELELYNINLGVESVSQPLWTLATQTLGSTFSLETNFAWTQAW